MGAGVAQVIQALGLHPSKQQQLCEDQGACEKKQRGVVEVRWMAALTAEGMLEVGDHQRGIKNEGLQQSKGGGTLPKHK